MTTKIFTDSWAYGAVSLPKNMPKLDYQNMLCLGSCFARNIMRWMEHHNITKNRPLWDILYNPFSIIKEFERLYKDINWQRWILEEPDQNGLTIYRDPWRSWLAAQSVEDLIVLNQNFDIQAKAQVQQAHAFLVTFGLSEVWSPSENQQIVLNQVPIKSIAGNRGVWQSRFASVSETVDAIQSLVGTIKENVAKDCPIVFTLSPVPLKHTASNLPIREANNLSKATLLVAIKQVAGSEQGVYYYPSYEMVQGLVEQGRPVWQKDGRHVTASVVEFVSKSFMNLQSFTASEIGSTSRFWVPLVNENGKIIGKLYSDETFDVE